MRQWIALLLGMVALSGCLSGDDSNDDDPTDGGTDETPDETPDLQTEFTFGPGAGCAGDALQLAGNNCVAFMNGASAGGPDGYWVPLNANYTGLAFTAIAANAVGDSDCFAVDENEVMMAGDFNAGQAPCAGIVPSGAAWLFVYSYAEPHTGITVTFTQ